ncbi:MAG: hypothetical protein ACRC7H_10850, partial [Plesiomonas shigelloides]
LESYVGIQGTVLNGLGTFDVKGIPLFALENILLIANLSSGVQQGLILAPKIFFFYMLVTAIFIFETLSVI